PSSRFCVRQFQNMLWSPFGRYPFFCSCIPRALPVLHFVHQSCDYSQNSNPPGTSTSLIVYYPFHCTPLLGRCALRYDPQLTLVGGGRIGAGADDGNFSLVRSSSYEIALEAP